LARSTTRIDTRVVQREVVPETLHGKGRLNVGLSFARPNPQRADSVGSAANTTLTLLHVETRTPIQVTTDKNGALDRTLPAGWYKLLPRNRPERPKRS
jgi:hypothetical protein